MVSDTKFGEITDKLIKMIRESTDGMKMVDAKKVLRKIVHNGQSVDDAIRYLQDCGEISIKRLKDDGAMYLTINDQSPSQSQPSESTSSKD